MKSYTMTPQARQGLRNLGARLANPPMNAQSQEYQRRLDATQQLIQQGKPTGLPGQTATDMLKRGMAGKSK